MKNETTPMTTPIQKEIAGNTITPPPELVQQWSVSSPIQVSDETWAYELFIAHQAAQWGANQELEACCEWLQHDYPNIGANALRAARRPKTPSLKEQALAELENILKNPQSPLRSDTETIRRAIEALPND